MTTYHIRDVDNRVEGRLALVTGARYSLLPTLMIHSMLIISVVGSVQLLPGLSQERAVMSYSTATPVW